MVRLRLSTLNFAFAASRVKSTNFPARAVIAMEVEMQQPEALKDYFRERLQHYRNVALQYPRGTDPVYQKEEK